MTMSRIVVLLVMMAGTVVSLIATAELPGVGLSPSAMTTPFDSGVVMVIS